MIATRSQLARVFENMNLNGIRTKPVVHPEIGDEVPDKHVVESVGPAESDEGRDSDGDTKIAQQDQLSILGFVQRAGGVEVVDP